MGQNFARRCRLAMSLNFFGHHKRYAHTKPLIGAAQHHKKDIVSLINWHFAHFFVTEQISQGSLRIKKCHKKWKKSTIFLIPPSPRMFWTFLNLGKIGNLMSPSSDLIWEKFEIGKIWNLGNPPRKKNISLKHLKLLENHFNTYLFFVQLNHLESTFKFGENLKIQTPPNLKKSKF